MILHDVRSEIASFLLGGATPSLEVLRAAQLGAYAYSVLPPDDPQRDELRSDFLSSLTRHHRIREEVIPLLRSWSDSGVVPLLFKGFWLSEFVYPGPGLRFHGDVDVLFSAGEPRGAVEIATSQGWYLATPPENLRHTYRHNAFGIQKRDGATRIDGHHLILHGRTRWTRPQTRITSAIMERSTAFEWEGAHIRTPDPVDALLVLALQRCWGDGWRLKPADFLDFRLLVERFSITREALWRRATELRCERTLRFFLERCDPESGVLNLMPPSRSEYRRMNTAVLRERPTLHFERGLARALAAPRAMLDVMHELPGVLRVWFALRRPRPMHDLLRVLTPAPVPLPAGASRTGVVRGVRWAVRLLRVRPGGACLVRSLAIYRALRRRGWEVDFVSGVRSSDREVLSHAWVEYQGGVLPELNEAANRATYSENFRYPAATERSRQQLY